MMKAESERKPPTLTHCWWEDKLIYPFLKAILSYVSKTLKNSLFLPEDPRSRNMSKRDNKTTEKMDLSGHSFQGYL